MFEGRFPGWTQRGRGKKLGIANGKWQVVNSVPEEGRKGAEETGGVGAASAGGVGEKKLGIANGK
jgi:hypothetical protein